VDDFWELEIADIKSLFSATHFVVGSRYCEPIHGHDYNIRIMAEGSLNKGQMVIDFLDLKPIMRKITNELKGKILLPTKNSLMETEIVGNKCIVKIYSNNKEYAFPEKKVALLPIKNTTVEELARYIGEKIFNEIEKIGVENITKLKVWIGETKKQGSWYVKLIDKK